MNRVLIRNQKIFFKEILEIKNLNLKNLSKILDLNYSNLKEMAREKRSIPENLFNELLKHVKKQKYWREKAEIKPPNWGQIKGGKIRSAKLSKAQLKRIMKNIRKKRKLPKINIKLNKNFCEFFGALLGDGCLSSYKRSDGYIRYEIAFTGDKRYDLEYHKIIKKIIKNEFKINAYSYIYPSLNLIRTTIRNKNLFKALIKIGFPKGKKGQKAHIPKKLSKLPWEKKKYIIRGIFDTDGCFFTRKDEGHRYPYTLITTYSKKLLMQLKKELRNQGYPAYIHNHNVVIKGKKNIIRWFKDIGSSNAKHYNKYTKWKSVYGPIV